MTCNSKMWKSVVICSALACGVIGQAPDQFISKGKWTVDRTEQCSESDKYELQMEFRKNKVNRTHCVFNGFMDITEDLTEVGFGIYVEADKKVDGGYKLIHIFDENLFLFIEKFVKSNFKGLLDNVGAGPVPPLKKSYYKVEDFSFDYSELPEDGMLGSYRVTAYITRDTPEKERLACFMIHSTFAELDDDDDDDE